MISVTLVSETVIDRAAFMPIAQQVTGKNHVTQVDKSPGPSRLFDDVAILRDFGGVGIDLSTAVTNVGFLIATEAMTMTSIIEVTRGTPFILPDTNLFIGMECALFSGTLCQWRDAVLSSLQDMNGGPVRTKCFNLIYGILCQRGFGYLFTGYHTHEERGGVFLLLENRK